jgi:glycogen debranching enzyme
VDRLVVDEGAALRPEILDDSRVSGGPHLGVAQSDVVVRKTLGPQLDRPVKRNLADTTLDDLQDKLRHVRQYRNSMANGSISILDGSTFVLSDLRGDVHASPEQPHGFFFQDTRFLSRWVLTVNGQQPAILSTDETRYYEAQFFLTPQTGTVYKNPPVSLMRKRVIGNGFHEEITILNHAREPVELELRIEADSDFADLFEVKDALAKKGELYRRLDDGVLVLGYRREDFVRETTIHASKDSELDEQGFTFRIHLEPHSNWNGFVFVNPVIDEAVPLKYRHADSDVAKPNMRMSLERWIAEAPQLSAEWEPLSHSYGRSLIDLAALRFYSEILPDLSLPAAGLPWFMTLFGRDSLITSYQALPFVPELADTTLRVLAARQGTAMDDFRDEEPGKIMHEIRFGELTFFGERPHSPYYGSADSTPLFLVLLDEYERWSGDSARVRELEGAARAALRWIDEYGDLDGDGYVEYRRRNTKTGLENQCWKDSDDSILFADGSESKLPRAVCEIQGYVYDAKVRCARLAREVWDDVELAERLERDAAELRRRFNEDFWLEERGFYALALDGDKRQVDSLTSNIGHLLWSGIADEDKAASCVRHLLGEELFSGWGVRTMGSAEGGYNPIRYHNGTVWPHDNSLIALGLWRYGYREEAGRIAEAILEAGAFFRYRLPEVFAGYARDLTEFPVQYPTSCSPQAWATGTPLVFLRTMLGLDPDGDELRFDPAAPDGVGRFSLTWIPGRWGRADASF